MTDLNPNDYRWIVLKGGMGEGKTMMVPKIFPVNYAEDEEGSILYVNSGNRDEKNREIWVPLETIEDPEEG